MIRFLTCEFVMIFFIAMLTLVISCSDAAFESKIVDVDNNVATEDEANSSKIDKPDIQPGSSTDNGEKDIDSKNSEDDERASEPGMISGAFLVRECVEKESNENEIVILCRVLNEETKAKSSEQFDWNFKGADDEAISGDKLNINYLDDGSSWHIEIRTAVPIKVSVKLDSEDEQIEQESEPIKGEDELLGVGPSQEEENPDDNNPPDPVDTTPTITENFTGNTYNAVEWDVYNTVAFANDKLRCEKNSNVAPVISHSGFTSKMPRDYTGGSASIEVTELVTLDVIEAQAFIWGIQLDSNNRAHFLVEGNNLIARYMSGGAIANVFARAYNAATDKFFKISHDVNANTLVYEVSTDGTNWIIFAQAISQWSITDVIFEYHCGAWGAFSGSFSSTVDNISIYLPSEATAP